MHFSYLILAVGWLTTTAVPSARAAALVYRRNLNGLDYLRHVLVHEKEWSMILKERVKKLDPPPYSDRFDTGIVSKDLFATDGSEFDTRAIVAEIVYNYSTVGSFIGYAAKALHLSLKCHSVKQSVFQMNYLVKLFVMNVVPGVILAELTSLKENVALFIDKLSIVPADLSLFFDLYWEVVKLMQYDVVHYVKHMTYPSGAKDRLIELRDQHVSYLNGYCTPYELDQQFFAEKNIDVGNMLLLDDVLNSSVDQTELLRVGRAHAKFVATYYRSLGVKTMSRTLWGQIFYYTKPLPKRAKVNETNEEIVQVQEID